MVTLAQYQVSLMVTSAQLRAARALLDWTVRELAEQADVHRNTITRAETDATAHGHAVAQVVLTLEAAGVEFTNGDRPGVRLRSPRGNKGQSGKEIS
jgi:transcriptional regulator with XRE-family HTH domain